MPQAQLRLASDTQTRALPKRVRMTDRLSITLPAPSKSQQTVYDSEQPRLGLLITANGARTWYVYKRHEVTGRPTRLKIGTVAEINVKTARDRAVEILANGIGATHDERKRQRDQWTLQQLFDAWQQHSKLRKRSVRDDADTFTRYCGSIAGRKLGSIDGPALTALHNKIGSGKFQGVSAGVSRGRTVKGGPYVANRARALLSAMFNFAVRQNLIDRNPVLAVEKFPEQRRERILQPDEVPRYVAAANAETDPNLRDFFLMLLYTGQRRGNVQSMRWDDVDLAGGIWRIPADSHKSKMLMPVPLAPEALELLKARSNPKLDREFVFPGHGRTGHLAEPHSAWERLLQRANITELRMHDVRRTYLSVALMNGVPINVVSKMAGHRSLQSILPYARQHDQAVRVGVETAMTAMRALANPTDSKNN